MKALIKATGEIVSVKVVEIGCDYKGRQIFVYEDDKRRCFADNELDFDSPESPDYWTRLEHTYAGMAMQSYVSNNVYLREIRGMCKEPQEMRDLIADLSILLATTLVQKLKEKEERK